MDINIDIVLLVLLVLITSFSLVYVGRRSLASRQRLREQPKRITELESRQYSLLVWHPVSDISSDEDELYKYFYKVVAAVNQLVQEFAIVFIEFDRANQKEMELVPPFFEFSYHRTAKTPFMIVSFMRLAKAEITRVRQALIDSGIDESIIQHYPQNEQ